jgi:hypothetical protein
MKDQDIEEKFIILYLQLIENHFLGETISEKAELEGGLDTVEKAVLRVKKLLAVVRQAIRLASSCGPEEYVFRIESKDKEIPSSPPTHHNNQNRSSNDTTNAQNDKRLGKRCHRRNISICHLMRMLRRVGTRQTILQMGQTLANNSEKSFKNSLAGTGIWRLVGADKFMTNKIIPGYEIVKKDDLKLLDDDYNARRANNPPKKTQKTSVNYKGSNPKPYDQLYGKLFGECEPN